MVPRRLGVAAAPLVAALAVACATAPPAEDAIPSAESSYRRALEVLEGRRVFLFFRSVDYDRAIDLLQEVVDNYPYSVYATLAELKIADIHFERGEYEEAATFYQDFLERHPNHPQAAYALYRKGLCAFRRMRAPDQDPTPTLEAIAQFEALLERFPDSEYAALARDHLRQATWQLARHDVHVAEFYRRRGFLGAAVKRYQSALERAPDLPEAGEVRLRLAETLVELGERDEARRALEPLAAAADGELAERARAALARLAPGGAAER